LSVGRKQERPLIVFGRYMRIACARKAKELGIKHYSWRRLSRDSGVLVSVITKGVSGEDIPEPENVWKMIEALQPYPKLEQRICESLKYSTQKEYEDALAGIDDMEKAEGIQP